MPLDCYYSVARYVPDVIRGEAVNIGVVLELQENGKSQKSCAFAGSFLRAHKIEPELSGPSVDKVIGGWVEQLKSIVERPDVSLNDLVNNYSGGKMQLTSPRFTRADNLEGELRSLNSTFVLEEKQPRDMGLADRSLRKNVKDAFRKEEITDHIEIASKKVPIEVEGLRQKHRFDFRGKTNGTLDLIRCISFDNELYRQKLDASKALIYDAKDVRAKLKNATIISILQPPIKKPEVPAREAFHSAKDILIGEGIITIDFNHAQERRQLIDMLKSDLFKHKGK
jgi:hypothetical protein